MVLLILRLLLAVIVAFFLGKLISKVKLPAILGWLIAGMILGPHAVGLLIGTELVWNKIKKSGKQLIITTLTQSLGTFFVVSVVFAVVFYFTGIPLYLALIFGGIALATAPAPALSVVREFKTDGPVTRTLIPMAALDDMVGVVVFFSTISIISAKISEQKLPIYMILLIVLLPIIIGIGTGVLAGFLLKKENIPKKTIVLLITIILISSGVGFIFDKAILPEPVLNFMLIGMAFSATFANMISKNKLEEIMSAFNPILDISMIIVILNLGTPLDYHLILGAGLFTAIYIISRAVGKYSGAFFGAAITHSPQAVKKYLGLTLLPHSGVSLVFTGIAVSVLKGPAPEYAKIIQGTIAAAAVINEVIAVIVAKKAFEWAGEFHNKYDIEFSQSN
ncbi:cation:proton antiporter [Clostridium sporogenes]|uniref:Potassium transporter n=1 Tax=Clostridium botulinum TaxID=1491 RepID=A0A6M0SY66_CLOBO|nr:cation:proton antiporter [Clostridium sporogenes]NFA60448.1 potassium transporter [Clostridium botulinum]NFI72267.1 potassium transporter [Clostridium sporogenes]NFL72619.1 potassium transporter [Clostridium sporogenes]NFM24530.1 potassium transporter [Clostridium sporogenes]NFP60885.1 potassium transporter [Clostridium sporogenes]